MVSLRRELHRHPELSWKEHRTAERVVRELDRLGLSYRTGIAGTGILADVPGRVAQGPVVALRADMDGLPIEEETGLSFTSANPGVMHACGHDGHVSALIGAAELLVAEPPPTPVRLLFQPAEETGEGARAMVLAGALEGVGLIFGGHLDRHYLPGQLIVTRGPVNASTDFFRIDIHGQGGHGGRPHEAIDAVVIGSLLVTALQTIVSREVDPAHPSVVSVGTFHAGTASNVISGSAELTGTIRAQEPKVRHRLHGAVRRIATAIAQLHGAAVDVELKFQTPALINSPAITELAHEAAVRCVGPAGVRELHTANMGGEDFACYLEQVPGCYVRYGAQVEGRESFPAHSSQFDFAEEALGHAAAWLAAVARLGGERLLNGDIKTGDAP